MGDHRGQAVIVDVYADDKKIATLKADLLRKDVEESGRGKGYYGYFYRIPKNDKPRKMAIKYAGTDEELEKSSVPRNPGDKRNLLP